VNVEIGDAIDLVDVDEPTTPNI